MRSKTKVTEEKIQRARGVTPIELAERKSKQRLNTINKAIEKINARLHEAYDPLDPKKGCCVEKIDYPEEILKEIFESFDLHWIIEEGPVVAKTDTKDVHYWRFTPRDVSM